MIELYRPRRIVEARIQIEKEHTKTAKAVSSEDEQFKALVMRIVKQRPDSLSRLAEVLTEKQVQQLGDYICFNFWKVNLENIFTVLSIKNTENNWERIFESWQQNAFREQEAEAVCGFLAKMLDTNEQFRSYLKSVRIDIKHLGWMKSKKYVDTLGKDSSYDCIAMYEFDMKLQRNGVIRNSSLWEICRKRFLLVCKREAYLNLRVDYICHKYAEFSRGEKKMFAANLYEELEIGDLSHMSQLLTDIDGSFSDSDMKQILSSKAYELYKAWLRIKMVEEAFADDDDPSRKTFWRPYALKYNAESFPRTLVLDFGEYVVVEFKGRAAGPAYLYTKDDYKNIVYQEMIHKIKGLRDWELRNYLYHFDFQEYLKRPPIICPTKMVEKVDHRGDWTGRARRVLQRYGIIA